MPDVTTETGLLVGLAALDWAALRRSIDVWGYGKTGPLLTSATCKELISLYETPAFRSRIIMERHAFGYGEYKYFAYPLPPLVQQLRAEIYPRLVPIARAWAPALGLVAPFPDRLEAFSALCRAHGQTKPTPLLLRYEAGDFNCLHQDLYGEVVFPLQLTFLLSRPGRDFTGGEFLLVEQRPRAQSKGEVVTLEQGEAVIFATRHRPVAGRRGTYRANLRHGVSRITSGRRFSLGIIFHDAA